MYSPKIREDLIPRIYRAAKTAGVAMTTWVNQQIESALPEEMEVDQQKISADQRNVANKLRGRSMRYDSVQSRISPK
jgi:hypothetical protein